MQGHDDACHGKYQGRRSGIPKHVDTGSSPGSSTGLSHPRRMRLSDALRSSSGDSGEGERTLRAPRSSVVDQEPREDHDLRMCLPIAGMLRADCVPSGLLPSRLPESRPLRTLFDRPCFQDATRRARKRLADASSSASPSETATTKHRATMCTIRHATRSTCPPSCTLCPASPLVQATRWPCAYYPGHPLLIEDSADARPLRSLCLAH